MNLFVCLNATHCFDHFVIRFEIEFFVLFKIVLTILGSLHFHMDFRDCQFQKLAGILSVLNP